MAKNPLVGNRVRVLEDIEAYDHQDGEYSIIPAGCILAVEDYQPIEPSITWDAYYDVWLETNECNDPPEDMRAERWHSVSAYLLEDRTEKLT
jgi:hypothetical protein